MFAHGREQSLQNPGVHGRRHGRPRHAQPRAGPAPARTRLTLHYLGSETGPERALAEGAGLPFHAFATGKLRRYFSWRNFSDPFRVARGVFQAWSLARPAQAALVFSKGGFVSVPVVYAAAMRGIPVVLHESDLTPGLANRLSLFCCERVCASFPETLDHLPSGKAVLTGTPIREELFRGDRLQGLRFLGFDGSRPLLLVMGGSLGAKAVNEALRQGLDALLATHDVAHLCGKGWLDPALEGRAGYRQFEFLGTGWRT